MKNPTARTLLLALLATPVFAQIGDKKGEDQKPIVPPERIPPAPALSPEQELATFQVAPGYRVELVASEPLVGDPVLAQFAPDGRLWVAEMRAYMPDLDGKGEDQPNGQIAVLTDTDGDGRMDRRTVFLDGLYMPRALAFARDGVLVGDPPTLWFCRDTDGDGRADQKTEVATDFGVRVDPARPALANPERAPNSLLWGHDNWLYAGAYAARFQFRNGTWQREPSTFRGQWGLSQDDWGRLYYNNNSDQLRADLLPSLALGRNPHLAKPEGTNFAVAKHQTVWPARVNPGINRGYRPEMLSTQPGTEFRLKECTAACAPWIYRGHLLDAVGDAFVCEPAGNLVKRNRLPSEQGVPNSVDAHPGTEFLASTDERFRPVNLTTGPDGALYIVDFYRGVIQHRISLTSYLRSHIERQNLHTPIGLGRIWRVVPDDHPKSTAAKPALDKAGPADWIRALAHPNSWQRETAQRLLVERAGAAQREPLESFLASAPEPLGRLHALWTLDGLGLTRWPVLQSALRDPDPRVRRAALRVSESLLATPDRDKVLREWIDRTGAETVPEVQVQLALSLGEARHAATDLAGARLWIRHPALPLLRDALLSGMAGRELELLEQLLPDSTPDQLPLLSALARCVFAERKPDRVERCLAVLAGVPSEKRAVQDGLLRALATHPSVTAKQPIRLASAPAPLEGLAAAQSSAAKQLLLDPRLVWPGKPGVSLPPPVRPLSASDLARFETGRQLFQGICAACHQPHGRGLEGLAPPLADSEWVLGSPDRLSRILLHGVRGPLMVKGTRFNLDMPAMAFFSDQQMADLLTYVRREWNHGAEPVTADMVHAVRSRESGRQDAWTEPELLAIP